MAKFVLHNKLSTVEVDQTGAAIVSFALNQRQLNPLSFRLPRTSDPEAAHFQGHFICLPRWGDPTPGEQKKGLLKHGDISLLDWSFLQHSALFLEARVTSAAEEMSVKRWMFLDEEQPVLQVTEQIKNISSFIRMVNVVQHPTIAAPFLDDQVIVNCNGSKGFTNLLEKVDQLPFTNWPHARLSENSGCDLQRSDQDCSGVFSYTIHDEDEFGWITAYSPKHNLLIGYIWKKNDYPWINCWVHAEAGSVIYRGLEFGTTGIHQSVDAINASGHTKLFNESTLFMLDAGEQKSFAYTGFLLEPDPGFRGMESVRIGREGIIWKAVEESNEHLIKTPLTAYYGMEE